MTLPGETVYHGAPVHCPDCGLDVPGPHVMMSAAGYYIGYGGCNCGPAYSRESGYFKTRDEAEKVLQAHSSEYVRDLAYSETGVEIVHGTGTAGTPQSDL